jgi:hypothetical protein
MRLDEDAIRRDASKLGLKIHSTDRKRFTEETTAGKCEFGYDVAPEVHLTGDGMLVFADGGRVVLRIGAEGAAHVTEEEGRLLLQGVPYAMLDEVGAAHSHSLSCCFPDMCVCVCVCVCVFLCIYIYKYK